MEKLKKTTLVRWAAWLGIILLALWLSACSTNGTSQGTSLQAEGAYDVDHLFEPFYAYLGGQNILGVAISPLIDAGQYKFQYTENALMQFDSQASRTERYSLSSLGNELGLKETPVRLAEQPGILVVDGYQIYEEFIPNYEKLQRSRFAGRPLSQVRINRNNNRIEQYFANVGFYISLDDPERKVNLLSYGAWKCNYACRHPVKEQAIVTRDLIFPEPFLPIVLRLDPEFIGKPVSEPYLATDGKLEQIYENAVLVADPNNIRMVSLRPISRLVGYEPSLLVTREADPRSTLEFVKLDGDRGLHVPVLFMDYIIRHGGMEISGLPLTGLFQDGSVYRQCFTNICLDYDSTAAPSLRIRSAPLGRRFMELYPPANTGTFRLSSQNTYVKVWETYSLIDSAHSQEIHIQVMETVTAAPIPEVQIDLAVHLPDGSIKHYVTPPTDAQGQTVVTIPPIQAPNGTLVTYQACLTGPDANPLCTIDSFVIWGNP